MVFAEMLRKISLVFLCAGALALGGCGLVRRESTPGPSAAAVAGRIPLDPEVSPVSFRWLSSEAVLVRAKIGNRVLAGFGNYVCRVAARSSRAHLEIWDNEDAWKRAADARDDIEQELPNKRAEYIKESEVVNRYTVFDRKGAVVYQRDFRAWPLTSLD